jgi:transmembrane sensor
MTRVTDNPSEQLDRIEREAHNWLVRFTSGQATPADLNDGKLWCERDPAHAAAFQRATRMWEALGPEAFQASRPVRRSISSSTMSRRMLIGGGAAAMAASAAYLVAKPPLDLWPSWSELAADYRTRTGERRRIVVADNGFVEMNTQTSIAMRHVAKDTAGLELISGEAMVATPPDTMATFVVTSGDGQTSASGAKFNVRNDGRSVCVTCIEGDVRVAYGAAIAALHARQQISYDRSGLGAAITIDPVTVTAWQEDLLTFTPGRCAMSSRRSTGIGPGKSLSSIRHLARGCSAPIFVFATLILLSSKCRNYTAQPSHRCRVESFC